MKLIGVSEAIFMPTKQNWLVCILFNVTTANDNFIVGEDSDEIAFMDPEVFIASSSKAEKMIYTSFDLNR